MKKVSEKEKNEIVLIALLSKSIEILNNLTEVEEDKKIDNHKSIIYSIYNDFLSNYNK